MKKWYLVQVDFSVGSVKGHARVTIQARDEGEAVKLARDAVFAESTHRVIRDARVLEESPNYCWR
jgi:hypothetical protein